MELKVEEGRMYDTLYYTVQPQFGADIHTWFAKEWYIMEEWCVETFGPTPVDGIWTPGSRWYANSAKFWFKHKKDLEWFVLRWQ